MIVQIFTLARADEGIRPYDWCEIIIERVGNDLSVVPWNLCELWRANTVRPYGVVIYRWVCMKFYLVRADEGIRPYEIVRHR